MWLSGMEIDHLVSLNQGLNLLCLLFRFLFILSLKTKRDPSNAAYHAFGTRDNCLSFQRTLQAH